MKSLTESVGPAIKKVLKVAGRSRRLVGTAFAVNSRMVLTCRHVVRADDIAGSLVLDGGHLGDIGQLEWLVHGEATVDVALGVTDESTFRAWLTPACVDVAALTAAITCVGYGSEDRGIECWQDNVAGEDRRYGLVTVQNSLHRGCSGGPVLDNSRRAVAICVARHRDGAAKYILPVRSFYAWMQDRGFTPMEQGAEADGERPWLMKVPIGPMVRISDVPREVVEAFAQTLCSGQAAKNHLAGVNALVLKNNPEALEVQQITLQEADQPAFDVPRNFWVYVFSVMGARSRRSVAALLEAKGAPNPRVQDERTQRAFRRFRNCLLNGS